MGQSYTSETDSCMPVREVLARIGDKWSVQIVMFLGDGPKRFMEIQRLIEGISKRDAGADPARRTRAGWPHYAHGVSDRAAAWTIIS